MSRSRSLLGAMQDIERLRPVAELAEVNGRAEVLERIDPPVAAIVQAVKELKEALQPDPRRVRYLQGAERAASLVVALEAGAKACGAGLFAADSLHGLVVDHAPSIDKIWWHSQRPGIVVGILRSEPEIRRTLAERNVLIWEGKRAALVPSDDLWRLVHRNRLTAHGDIRRWVTQPWEGGRRCRCCGIIENPLANELQPFELEKRFGAAVVNGVVAIAGGGGVLVHDECRAQWVKWVEIASRYESQEEAEAADAVANVKPRGGSPAKGAALALERQVGEPPPREFPPGGGAA